MSELVEHYGFIMMIVFAVMIVGWRALNTALDVWRLRHVDFIKSESIESWFLDFEKPKHKRTSPEQWLSETLEDIADAEQRPRLMEPWETPSDIAQMRDLAWQEYLRLCTERNLRATARPLRILQMPSDADAFHEAYRDYEASLDDIWKGRQP